MELFEDEIWQMSFGERAAVEGVLSALSPQLAIEIGSAEGACLRRIAAHAGEVHSFDLSPPTLDVPDNVVLHTGDSHELLHKVLEELADQDRNVDFVMVDGDHSAAGVRRDIEDLLHSRAVGRTVILIHDTANEEVRRGLEAVRFRAWPKVTHVELDCVPGFLFREPALRHELWYGLGLVLVDASQPAYLDGNVYETRYYESAPLFAEIRDMVVAREAQEGEEPPTAVTLRQRVAQLEAELDGARADIEGLSTSMSWKLTAPLRAAKARVRRAVR